MRLGPGAARSMAGLCLLLAAGCAGSDDPFAPATGVERVATLTTAAAVSNTICSAPGTTELWDGAAWVPAYEVTPHALYGPAIGTSVWLGPTATSVSEGVPVGSSYFRTQFILPSTGYFTNATLEGSLYTDDNGVVSLNGTAFFSTPIDLMTNFGWNGAPPMAFSTSTGFIAGVNTVEFELANAIPGSTAIDFCFTVAYETCPAAPAVANAVLSARGYKNNSTTSRYITALVSDHMTKGAIFDGLAPCDTGYAAAVEAFVAAALGG